MSGISSTGGVELEAPPAPDEELVGDEPEEPAADADDWDWSAGSSTSREPVQAATVAPPASAKGTQPRWRSRSNLKCVVWVTTGFSAPKGPELSQFRERWR